VQIPKVQKYSQAVRLFALLGSAQIKASLKMLVKSTPDWHGTPTLAAGALVKVKFKHLSDLNK